MSIEDYLTLTLLRLERVYIAMSEVAGKPIFIDDGVYPRFRHATLSDALTCYLKGVKALSTLNACLVLLRSGYAQEIGAVCRMVDDYCNEVFFLLVPQDGDHPSADQIRFVETFFQEEFDKPDNPLGSSQKRDTVSVRKIHATFAKLAGAELNPSDGQELLRTTHQAFSGYIHGAYPHIMEMCGGMPPRFHVRGMLGTPRIDEWREQLTGYVHRLIMVTTFIARKLQQPQLEPPLRALLDEFERDTGSALTSSAKDQLAELKKREQSGR